MSPWSPYGPTPERSSHAPLAVDVTGSMSAASRLSSRPQAWRRSWVGMSGYLIAGIGLGLLLILAFTLSRSHSAASAAPRASAAVVTDDVTHLHARDIGESCWRGIDGDPPARLTVSFEIGIDGKVQGAAASGQSAEMRSCVETHVKTWEFLPQAAPATLALPVEVDRE